MATTNTAIRVLCRSLSVYHSIYAFVDDVTLSTIWSIRRCKILSRIMIVFCQSVRSRIVRKRHL